MAIALTLLLAAAPALARADDDLVAPSLSLDLGEALAQVPAPAEPPTAPPEPTKGVLGYGRADSQWLTLGLGYASDFQEDNDFNFHAAWSTFLADGFEFAVEGAGWYFNQEGPDTGGVSGSMVFRWHFSHAKNYDWTIFTDFGIGLLAGFDDVPNGGTSFNFLPRIGFGYTRAFDPTGGPDSTGPRWMVGVRWHHISNARIEGDERNPARDSLLFYVGITLPL